MRSTIVRIACALLLAASFVPAASAEECHEGFSAYVAAQPYILNPAVAARSSTTIVAAFEDSEASAMGFIPFRALIRSAATGRLVAVKRGLTTLPAGQQAGAEARWDGRDDRGQLVEDGEYVIQIAAARHEGVPSIDFETQDVEAGASATAKSSEVHVVVDRAGRYDALFDVRTRERLRIEAQAAALDTTFPYQFFFGTNHAHTIWSDGGMPNTDCTSGRYGYAGGAVPSDAFSYAKTTGGVDFIAVVEHNHLMQDACSSCTAEQIKTRYQSGFTAAQTATVPGSFVGLFGMEWGVISGGGHINVYNQQQLMSWTGEPYHVLTDKSNYPMLYTAMKNNQGTLGSYGAFNHPNSSDFGSWTRSADGDAVMRGLSIVSGPAFNTSTTFAPGGSTYPSLFKTALSYGWKIAPETHQDNHCWNFGNSTPNRTVALIPNGSTFNQSSLVSAIGNRRFYAQQDRDMQLVFRTADGARVMGDSFSASGSANLFVGVTDPAGEAVQKIEIWGGRAGTTASPGAAATIVASNLSSTTLSATIPAATAGQEWYYFVTAVQADGNTAWSAPMWITWGSGCTNPGTAAPAAPANASTGVATSTTLSWSAASGATSYDVYFGTATSPAFYSNVTGTSVAVSGLTSGATYYWRVVPKNSCGSAASTATWTFTTASGCTLPAAATLSSPASGATGVATSTTLSWSAASGATSYDVYFGTASSPAFHSNVAGTSVAVTGTSGTTYYWRVVAKNACGAAPSSATRSYTTGSSVVTLLSEGAESGATGWTFTKNTGSGWSIETSTDSYAGSSRFKTNVGYTTYLHGADWSVVSPTFSLAGRTASTLTFYNKYKTESGYDYFRVEISTNGGTSWTQLRSVSGTSSGYPAWAPQVSLSLGSYVGNSTVKLRFRFTSDSSVADWGVALDNVVVTAQ